MNDRFKMRLYDNGEMYYINDYYFFEERGIHSPDDFNIIAMQCTGIKDDNGKLIYEGDILKIKSSGNSFIVQCVFEMNYGYGIDSPSFALVGVDGCNHHYSFSCDEKIIIGNIYENEEEFLNKYRNYRF